MGDRSEIEWTDASWTPIRARRRDTGKVGVHCERVSEACRNCYAATFNNRNLPSHGTGLDFTVPNRELVDVFVDEEMLMAPLRWKKPRKIFVCSQTDLFGEFVTNDMIDRVFAVMALCPKHTFQVLTKRPERMMEWFRSRPAKKEEYGIQRTLPGYLCRPVVASLYSTQYENRHWVDGQWPLPNVWLGVTAENQQWADKRIPLLLQTPAAKRFVSAEPMLGPVDLRDLSVKCYGGIEQWDALDSLDAADAEPGTTNAALDWVICGGESGPGARPMHPEWARSLRDQCVATGVPFFFKQWGEWAPVADVGFGGREKRQSHCFSNGTGLGTEMNHVGKRAGGRLLDGREWNEFPEVGNV